MSTSFDERISAFIDGELTEFESRRVTGEVLKDSDMHGRCQRYMLAGDAIRDELPASFDSGFADRVMQAIDEEDVQVSTASTEVLAVAKESWKKPLAGAAIAASVAALALVSLQALTGSGETTPSMPMALMGSPTVLPTNSHITLEPLMPQIVAVAAKPVAEPQQAKVTTLSSEAGLSGGMTNFDYSPVEPTDSPRLFISDQFGGYLATHSEFASRSGFMSRIRVIGFEPEPLGITHAVER